MKQLKSSILLVCLLLLWLTDVSGSSIFMYPLSYNLRNSSNYYLCTYQFSKPDSVILKDKKTGKLVTVSEKVCFNCGDRLREDTTLTFLIFESPDSSYWYATSFKADRLEEEKMMQLFDQVKPIFRMRNIKAQARSYKAWVVSITQIKSLRWSGIYELSRESVAFTKILPKYAKRLHRIRGNAPALYKIFTVEEQQKLFEAFSSFNSHSCAGWDVVLFLDDQYNQQIQQYIYSYFKRYIKEGSSSCYSAAIRCLEARDKNEEVQKVIASFHSDPNWLSVGENYLKQLVVLYDERN